jgi:4-hydroxy-tetrahydrodipicolinate reductase
MGRAAEAALAARGHEVVGRVGKGEEVPSSAHADVALEFTSPSAAAARVEALLRAGIPVVSGTTGWDVAPMRKLAAERGVGFLHSANFSIGVAVLKRAAALAASALAPFPEFEAGIVERHHSAKKDAPSGTANVLADTIALASGRRPAVASLRQGGQPGEHVIVFEGAEESVELAHRARSRGIFAAGAVRAAEWLVSSGPKGPASFDDVFERRTP